MWNTPALTSRSRRRGSGHMVFPTPEALWSSAVQYFQWVEDNPLVEEKVFFNKDGAHREDITHPRPMTLKAMWVHMNIGKASWYDYRAKEDYANVCEEIDSIIYEQKFSYAAADMMNAQLIGKELGIAEVTKHTGNVAVTDMSNDEIDRKLEELRRLSGEQSTEDTGN